MTNIQSDFRGSVCHIILGDFLRLAGSLKSKPHSQRIEAAMSAIAHAIVGRDYVRATGQAHHIFGTGSLNDTVDGEIVNIDFTDFDDLACVEIASGCLCNASIMDQEELNDLVARYVA